MTIKLKITKINAVKYHTFIKTIQQLKVQLLNRWLALFGLLLQILGSWCQQGFPHPSIKEPIWKPANNEGLCVMYMLCTCFSVGRQVTI